MIASSNTSTERTKKDIFSSLPLRPTVRGRVLLHKMDAYDIISLSEFRIKIYLIVYQMRWNSSWVVISFRAGVPVDFMFITTLFFYYWKQPLSSDLFNHSLHLHYSSALPPGFWVQFQHKPHLHHHLQPKLLLLLRNKGYFRVTSG